MIIQLVVYKLIAIDLRNQQKLDADPKAIQHINTPGNLKWDGNTQMLFIIEEQKKPFRFFERNRESIILF